MDWSVIGGKILEMFFGIKNVKKVVAVLSNPIVGKVFDVAAEIAEPMINDLDELDNFLEGVRGTDEPFEVLMGRINSVFGEGKFSERVVKAILDVNDGKTGYTKKEIVIAAITDEVEKKVETKVKGSVVDFVFELVYQAAKGAV